MSISDGKGGSWSVVEGNYKSYYWLSGFIPRSYNTSVNTTTNMHLHTYCGAVDYFW